MDHHIIRFFHFLCLATALVLPASLVAESVPENTLPAARTLTSADGRTIEVVITAKTPTSIKAKKADGKEFELTLDKLSDADRAFVANLIEPAVKKPKLLFIGRDQKGIKNNEIVIEKLEDAGFELTIHLSVDGKNPNGTRTVLWPEFEKMSDEQIKTYDVIWEERGPRKRLLALFPTYQGVMVMKTEGNTRLKDFLADRTGSIYGTKPHIEVDDNLVRYHSQVITWVPQNSSHKHEAVQPEFIDKAVTAAKNLLKK